MLAFANLEVKKSNYNSYDKNYLIHRLSTYQEHPNNHHQTPQSQELPFSL
jgi:hypothetical protein